MLKTNWPVGKDFISFHLHKQLYRFGDLLYYKASKLTEAHYLLQPLYNIISFGKCLKNTTELECPWKPYHRFGKCLKTILQICEMPENHIMNLQNAWKPNYKFAKCLKNTLRILEVPEKQKLQLNSDNYMIDLITIIIKIIWLGLGFEEVIEHDCWSKGFT